MKRLRWSLKSWLAVIAVCCLIAAGLGMIHHRGVKQDSLIHVVQQQGGRVYLDHWGPRWLGRLGAGRYRRTVIGVTFETADGFSEESLPRFKGFPRLRGLDLGDCEVTDDGLAHVGDITTIRKLYLNSTPITDQGLRPLARLENLELLHLANCEISGDGLRHLRAIPNLTNLYLNGTPLTADGIKQLGELSHLEVLDLRNSLRGPHFDDEALQHIGRLESLRDLDLMGAEIGDEGMVHLARLKRLRRLNLIGTSVSEEGFDRLAALHNLEEISVCSWRLTGPGLRRLGNLRRLRKINVATEPGAYVLGGRLEHTRDECEIPVSARERTSCENAIRELKQSRSSVTIAHSGFSLPDIRGHVGQRSIDTPPLVELDAR